ncbi:ABC transporter substrate-binding protein [Ottowia pentelensis]|uniref:ABC transporter substrate-binding protein n=1 Tax=Ottowia pentelensis TaxID=511108 RepID=UPI003634B339
MKHTDLALSRRTVLTAAAAASMGSLPAWAQDKAPIQFATLLDFTRVYTFLTAEYSQGQQDYINLVNQEGGIDGHPIKLIIKDHASYPERGIALYNEAKAAGAVFFDFLSSPVANALMPRVDEDHMPMIAFAHGRADAADGDAFPYVFPSAAIYRSQAALLLKYIDEQEGGLKGKKIAFVHIDSAFGKEPIELIERVAKTKGFELKLYPYPVPGTEQAATWSEVRKNRPDKIIIWGAGPGQGVHSQRRHQRHRAQGHPLGDLAVRKRHVGLQGQRGGGRQARHPGQHRHRSGDPEAHRRQGGHARQGQRRQGQGRHHLLQHRRGQHGNRGAGGQAGHAKGGAPLTGEKIKAGYETIKDFTAEGLMPPLTITAKDHQGGGAGMISEWDGKQWAPKSDWGSAYQDVVWDLIKEDIAKSKEKK